jgi:hypothetical protein
MAKNHRCDIAVGAPLNSKSTQENTVVSPDQNGILQCQHF